MPSFNPFGAVTGRTSATLFEIRLDNDFIVLRGAENEASSQVLKGVVVLCLPAPLKVENVHLKLSGSLKVGWNDQRITPTGLSNNKIDRTTEIFTHRWDPFVTPPAGSSMRTLPAGNYEWPFEYVIPGSTPESVEGLRDSHIIYKLKATVARGKLAYDLHAYKPVRIVRTLDPAALELAHAMTVENVWPNKIEYSLEIPQKAIIFGTAIEVSMRFTSLLKGLSIGKIKCVLIETQEFTLAGASVNTERYWKYSRDIDTWTFDIHDEHYHDMLDDSGQDGWKLTESMPLPKKLSKCMQDVDVNGIKIRHKVKFNIALNNPDGHVSELRATLPVTIFISPNMPITEDGSLVDQTPMSTQTRDMEAHAPPLYGEHQLDQLYADIDMSGIMTPAIQSGVNTPFFAQSRTGSHENLASLNSAVESNGSVLPADLNQRLQNLNLSQSSRNTSFLRMHRGQYSSGANTPHERPIHHDDGSYFDLHSSNPHNHHHSNQHSNTHSNPLSRRTSEEGERHASTLTSGQHTPEHHENDLADLTKVPSYNTAVKTPTRGMSYSDHALPSYNTVISSTPSSPNGHVNMPAPPAAAEVARRSLIHPTTDNDAQRRMHIRLSRERAH